MALLGSDYQYGLAGPSPIVSELVNSLMAQTFQSPSAQAMYGSPMVRPNPFLAAAGMPDSQQFANDFLSKAQSTAQAGIEEQGEQASDIASGGSMLDENAIFGWLADQQKAIALNNVQKTLLGFAEGQMQSPYAGNRVFGASIAGAVGAHQKDIANKLSLTQQLMAYAQDMIDMKRKKIQVGNEELEAARAPELLDVRLAESKQRVQDAKLRNTLLAQEISFAPKKQEMAVENFELDRTWKLLSQQKMKAEAEHNELERLWALEDRPQEKLKLKLALDKAQKEVDWIDKQQQALVDQRNASANRSNSLANRSPGTGGGKTGGGGLKPFRTPTSVGGGR